MPTLAINRRPRPGGSLSLLDGDGGGDDSFWGRSLNTDQSTTLNAWKCSRLNPNGKCEFTRITIVDRIEGDNEDEDV